MITSEKVAEVLYHWLGSLSIMCHRSIWTSTAWQIVLQSLVVLERLLCLHS